MSISYPDNTASRSAIPASGLTDSTLIFDVISGGERSLSLAELKKTGVQVINVKQYGATGDGTTNDYTAITSAIAAGSIIYFPSGTYNIGSNTIEINSPSGKQLIGAGFQASASKIKSTASNAPAIRFSESSYSSLQNFVIENESGDGVHFVGCFKASCKNIWTGRGVRDVAFYNAGSQQLYMNNCWATANAPISSSSVIAKYGFVNTGFAKAGTTTSTTGLNGLTLTLNYLGSSTVTVSGNGLSDLATAINQATTTTGIAAAASNSNIILYSRSFSSASGINDDNALVLSNGTGAWTAAGLSATTYANGDGIYICNASTLESCHSEGMGWVNFLVHVPRHSDSARGNVRCSNCTFQGGGTTSSGPTYKGMIVIDEAHNCSFSNIHAESSSVACVVLDEAHNTSFYGGVLFDITILATQKALFSGVSIGGGTIDSSSTGTVFIGCQLIQSAGSGSTFFDSSNASTYIGCNGTNFASNSSGALALRTNNSDGFVVSYNGRFDYWNAGNTMPIGWSGAGSPTIARYAATNMVGDYSASVIVQSGVADTGLLFSIPVKTFQHWSGASSWVTVSFYANRLSSAAAAPSVICDHNYKNRITAASNSVNVMYPSGTWSQHQYAFQVPINAAKCYIILSPDVNGAVGARMFYSAVTISIGKNAPSDYALNGNEGDKLLVGGRWVDYGSAAPTSGYNLTGSIRYNTTPSGGATAFWVCSVEGNPGTWINGPTL